MTDIRSPSIRSLPVDELRLDDENPRLPERVRGRPQSEILRFLYENGVLEEIAQSYMDHGFFQNEPLIVTRENGQSHTVIEGNRRLATLKVLLGAPEADDLHSLVEPSPDRIEQLAEVPCFVVSSRDEIRAYVGFRHIGGIKTWDPEAKARYVLGEVARLVEHGSRDPFRELGRRIGSNTQGVRNSYLAIRILLYAREEFGLDVSDLQDNRFGVWLRCMNSGDIRRHIGLDQERTYEEIENHESSPYVAALAITIAHAFGVLPLAQVAPLFERMVTTALSRRGLRSVCLAEIRRSTHSFDDALIDACAAIGLKAAPKAAATLTYAHDEGVDVLCHLGWDGARLRAGTWGFIGQATVGRSDTWPRKIKGPSPSSWARRIGTRVRPLPFLAVPHHVEQPTMVKLTDDADAVVLDRLRLVQFKEGVDDDEQDVIRAVAGEDVEPLVG